MAGSDSSTQIEETVARWAGVIRRAALRYGLLEDHLDVLVLDCLRFKEHPTHLWLDKALEYVEKIKPRRAFFTHIAHDVKHERDSAKLPDGVAWAYDGLSVSDD